MFMMTTKLQYRVLAGAAMVGMATLWAIERHTSAKLKDADKELRQRGEETARLRRENDQPRSSLPRTGPLASVETGALAVADLASEFEAALKEASMARREALLFRIAQSLVRPDPA